MGYIGSSPVFPQTAFSIQILRMHHIIWKYCAIATQPFALALDEILDGFNPPMISPDTHQVWTHALTFRVTQRSETDTFGYLTPQPRRWRKHLTSAIEAYRKILTLIREKEFNILQMDCAAQLASNCPRCFGPPVSLGPSAHPYEPDIIVCMDGNFQHRRHQAASVPITGRPLLKPELFINPSCVEAMAQVTSSSHPPRKMNSGQPADINGLIVGLKEIRSDDHC